VSSSNAIEPRACNFCVLIPISAPSPNSRLGPHRELAVVEEHYRGSLSRYIFICKKIGKFL